MDNKNYFEFKLDNRIVWQSENDYGWTEFMNENDGNGTENPPSRIAGNVTIYENESLLIFYKTRIMADTRFDTFALSQEYLNAQPKWDQTKYYTFENHINDFMIYYCDTDELVETTICKKLFETIFPQMFIFKREILTEKVYVIDVIVDDNDDLPF